MLVGPIFNTLTVLMLFSQVYLEWHRHSGALGAGSLDTDGGRPMAAEQLG